MNYFKILDHPQNPWKLLTIETIGFEIFVSGWYGN